MIKIEDLKPGVCSSCRAKDNKRVFIKGLPVRPFTLCIDCIRSLQVRLKEWLEDAQS